VPVVFQKIDGEYDPVKTYMLETSAVEVIAVIAGFVRTSIISLLANDPPDE
jgi:hypothetical protein